MKEIKIVRVAKSGLASIDFSSLPFGKVISDHMFVVDFDSQIGITARADLDFEDCTVRECLQNAKECYMYLKKINCTNFPQGDSYYSSATLKYNSFTTFSSSYSMAAKRSRIATSKPEVTSIPTFHESSVSIAISRNGILARRMEMSMRADGDWKEDEIKALQDICEKQMATFLSQRINTNQGLLERNNDNVHPKTKPWQKGRQDIEKKLQKGKFKEAIEDMARYIETINPENSICRDFTVLSGRFYSNENRVVDDGYKQEQTKILHSLRAWMDELELFFREE